MAGTSYTRQSSLTDGDTITASLFNDEYNQLVNAFAYAAAGTTGHQHDGGAGEGGNIEIIGDADFKNKIIVDSTNNRWSVFVEVGGTAVEQVRIEDGVVYPVTDSDVDLGTDALRFKAAYIDSLTATGNLIVGGTLVVTGNVDFNGDLDVDGTTNLDAVDIDGAVDMATTLTVAGNVDFNGDLDVDGTIEFDAISGTGAVTVTNILDEDNMSSDSATALVTQQSVKAYVDAQVTAQDLDLTDGTTTIAIDLDSEALSVLGGTGVTSTASGNGVTLAIDSTVTTLTGSQTLTNKTLTTPAISGNLTTDGNIDGRDVAADGTKLDTVETNADVTDTTNVTAVGALMDSEVTNLAQVKAFDSTDYATAAQGTTADAALPKAGGAMTGAITTDSTFDGRDVAADGTKLDGIEASATADQTDAEIRTAVEAATDSNVFTDADHTKLNAIEASADVTDTTNVTAAGALMDSEVTNLAEVKAFDSSDYATAAQGATADAALPKAGGAMTGAITTNSTFDGRDVATDGSKLDGIETSADVTDATNVTAAGALMDSELTAIASVKALNQGVATGDSPTFTNLTLSGTSSVKVPAGTTAQRDGTPANGMFRYNSTNEQFEGYQNSEWGAIGGGGGSNTFTTDAFTGNGSTAAYALSQVINSENNLMVFIAGVFQQQSAYSIATASGTTTLTFSTAPANTREIVIYSIASAVSGSNLNIDSMTGDGSDVTLSLTIAPVNENNTQVFIDGVYQSKANYSISGTTLTFSTAPPTGSAVEVMTMTQTEVNVPVDGTITSAKLSGDLTLPGSLAFADNEKATFGAGDDLQIYHDGSASFISDQGTGHLKILAGDFRLNNAADNAQFISAVNGAEVNVFHNNALKIATTSTGIDVTGTATTDGVLSNGNGINDIPLEITHSWGASGTPLIKASNASSEVFRVQRNGSVGIGFTSPQAKLQVLDQLKVSTADQSQGVVALGDGSSTQFGVGIARWNGSSNSGGAGGLGYFSQGTVNSGGHFFYTGDAAAGSTTERMRIDSSGNVGIGRVPVNTLNPSLELVDGGSLFGYGDSLYLTANLYYASGWKAMATGAGSSLVSDGTGHKFYTNASVSAGATATPTERMRIDSSGNVLFGITSVPDGTNDGMAWARTGDYSLKIGSSDTVGNFQIRFYNGNGNVGNIITSGSATSYNTSSDYRLKENIADADDAGSKIDSIQVRKYDWKADGSHQDYGMVAQELQAVAPEAVSGDADSEDMMGVDYSKLVPLMLKEIQSLRNRVATLEE